MVLVVLHPANTATVQAIRPPNRVILGLRGDDLPLNARQQPLRFGQGHSRSGDAAEITGSVDLHDIRARPLAFSAGTHQPQNPGHASTLGQRTDAKIPNWPSHPQSCGAAVPGSGRGQASHVSPPYSAKGHLRATCWPTPYSTLPTVLWATGGEIPPADPAV